MARSRGTSFDSLLLCWDSVTTLPFILPVPVRSQILALLIDTSYDRDKPVGLVDLEPEPTKTLNADSDRISKDPCGSESITMASLPHASRIYRRQWGIMKIFPHPDWQYRTPSRIQGQKGTGFRIWGPDALQKI
jgi:hypothetical protein